MRKLRKSFGERLSMNWLGARAFHAGRASTSRSRRIGSGRGFALGRVALEGRVVHIPDVLADPEYHAPQSQMLGRWRTILGVPLLREGTTIGA